MSLVALDGTPLLLVGAGGKDLSLPASASLAGTTLDAANESCMMIGQIFTEDGASHTIDTSGSSSIGWRSGALTFASGSTAVLVGVGDVDASNGPPGRAVNVADVITFDVSRSITGGGGGITANAWQEHVPTSGTKTIANGDFVAISVQMTARGGTDSVVVQGAPAGLGISPSRPLMTGFIGGAYTLQGNMPNAVITFSDGVRGYIFGGNVVSTMTTTTWNNGSGTKEYGNVLQFPFPTRAYGLYGGIAFGGNADCICYSDPLGTPVAERTVSVDLNQIGASSSARPTVLMFSSPYDIPANTPVAAIIKPTSVSNNAMLYKTFNIAGHQKSEPLGQNCYAISRNTGAFAQVNSGKDRYNVGLIIGAFDAGGGGGLASPMHGMAVS